jgi:hypothetical protein
MQTVPQLATRSTERADEPEPTEAASDAHGVNSSDTTPEVAPPTEAPQRSCTPTTDAARGRYLTSNPPKEKPSWQI